MPSAATPTFDSWNELKKELDGSQRIPGFHEREICLVSIGHNVGSEQNGKGARFTRPVLVTKRFNRKTFLGIPLTSSDRTTPYHVPISFRDGRSSVVLSQIRLFDAARIERKLGWLPQDEFVKLLAAVREILT